MTLDVDEGEHLKGLIERLRRAGADLAGCVCNLGNKSAEELADPNTWKRSDDALIAWSDAVDAAIGSDIPASVTGDRPRLRVMGAESE